MGGAENWKQHPRENSHTWCWAKSGANRTTSQPSRAPVLFATEIRVFSCFPDSQKCWIGLCSHFMFGNFSLSRGSHVFGYPELLSNLRECVFVFARSCVGIPEIFKLWKNLEMQTFWNLSKNHQISQFPKKSKTPKGWKTITLMSQVTNSLRDDPYNSQYWIS